MKAKKQARENWLAKNFAVIAQLKLPKQIA